MAVIVFGGIVWLARPTTPNTQAILNPASGLPAQAGALTAEESSFDFGEISMAAGKVSHLFAVKNTGSKSVSINKLYTSCMCTTAMLKIGNRIKGPFGMPGHGFVPGFNESLAPNETAIIDVVFDPAAHGPAGVGPINRAVRVENNGGEPLELRITATVRP